MKSSTPKKNYRKAKTITFQPEPDVERLVNDYLATVPEGEQRGERTKLLNAALRSKMGEAVKLISADEIERALRRLGRIE